MFLGIMEHKKKLQLVHFKSYPNHAPSLKEFLVLSNFLFKKSLTLPPKTAEICSTPPQIWPKLVKSVHTHQKNGTLDVYGNFP